MRVRWRTAGIALAALTLAAGGCTGPGDDRADHPGVLTIGIAEPRRLLPTDAVDPADLQVLGALFSPLMTLDEQRQPTPLAAESVTSADNQLWTVRLRAGFTFHNGEPVTTDHYLAAWNYAAYGPHRQARSYLFSEISGYAALQPVDPDGAGARPAAAPAAQSLAGLRKVDDRTFTVALLQPFGEFPAMLTHPAFAPLPSAAWQAAGVLRDGFADAPVGNGPFRLRGAWRRGTAIEVERHPGHPGPAPKVTGVEFRIYPQLRAAYADVVAGKLDVVHPIPAERLGTAATDLSGRVYRSPGATLHLLVFPLSRPEFGDARARRAISKAIDRDALARTVFRAGEQPARSYVGPATPGHRADACADPCRYDPAAARRLYADAGGPRSVRLAYNTDGGHRAWIEAVCAQLAANLGIRCSTEPRPDFADLVTAVDRRQLPAAFRMSWDTDYPSMRGYLAPLFGSTGAGNYVGYRNAEVDSLLRLGGAARTREDAIRLYQRAEETALDDMPAVPLRFSQDTAGYSTAVSGLRTDPVTGVDLTAVARS